MLVTKSFQLRESSHKKFLASIESSRFVSHRARIPGDSDFLRQELQPKNLGKKSRILAELSLTELTCSRRSILKSFDNNIANLSGYKT